MSGPLLRRLTGADAPAVHALEKLGYVPTLSLAGYRRELGANELARYWGVFSGKQLLGYAGIWLIADEAHISIIVIHPTQRRRGLGEFLLLHLLLDAADRGAALALLEVRRSNRPAQALYARRGFQTIAERSGYYRDGEDALVMELTGLDDPAHRAAWRARYERLALSVPAGAPTPP